MKSNKNQFVYYKYGRKEISVSVKKQSRPRRRILPRLKITNTPFLMDTNKSIFGYLRLRNSRILFYPGQTVYVIVEKNNKIYIVKDIIDYVHCFGYLTRGYSIYYYLKNTNHSSGGITADCIFDNYNAAKFFLYF